MLGVFSSVLQAVFKLFYIDGDRLICELWSV